MVHGFNWNITRMECKGADVPAITNCLFNWNITRMECKEHHYCLYRKGRKHWNITRMGLRYNKDTERKAR